MPLIASTVLVLGALLGAVTGASSCAADNCLRAVRASAFPTRMGAVDCSSYLKVTVTPATVVITSRSTSVSLTTTTTNVAPLGRRRAGGGAARAVQVENIEVRQVTISASSIPAYASACSGAARYSSACSCIGVTKSTITVAAPLTTTTTTTTTTSVIVSTSILPPTPPTLEVLNYADGSCNVLTTPPSMIIVAGQCVDLPFQISENYLTGSFNPGTCATTAADCTVSFYEDGSCAEFETSTTADSTSCVYVGSFFSMKLTCPLCP